MPDHATYVTPDEIAAQLRVSPEAVRSWIREGKLAAYRFGRQLRVENAEFARFLAESKVKPSSGEVYHQSVR